MFYHTFLSFFSHFISVFYTLKCYINGTFSFTHVNCKAEGCGLVFLPLLFFVLAKKVYICLVSGFFGDFIIRSSSTPIVTATLLFICLFIACHVHFFLSSFLVVVVSSANEMCSCFTFNILRYDKLIN